MPSLDSAAEIHADDGARAALALFRRTHTEYEHDLKIECGNAIFHAPLRAIMHILRAQIHRMAPSTIITIDSVQHRIGDQVRVTLTDQGHRMCQAAMWNESESTDQITLPFEQLCFLFGQHISPFANKQLQEHDPIEGEIKFTSNEA